MVVKSRAKEFLEMMTRAQQLLKKLFGYSSFREGQHQVVESLLQKKDVFAIMPTGAGKSICYQIPALIFPGTTIVISPLISLMKDQVDGLNEIGIPATFINSSLKGEEVQRRLNKVRAGEYKLLYVAPERLQSPQFCRLLENMQISLLAIDEAHCVSQWGHDFRPSYGYISKMLKSLSTRPIVAAFTATATDEVKADIIKLLELKNPDVYVTGFDRPNLSFSVVKNVKKMNYVLDYLKKNSNQAGIIYCSTRKEVEKVYERLAESGYQVGRYHAGLSDEERQKSQEAFLYDDINVIIATNAFGMGIDKSNVRYVIHNNLPKNIEGYYQEAGRAGRDGEPGECILLFSAQDIRTQKFLIEETNSDLERKEDQHRKLQAMVDYCYTTGCLRKYILAYFGEKSLRDECDNCSNCLGETELEDITIEAQKIFSCIYRMNQRWGVSLVANVLGGSRNKKVLENGFDRLSTYGIMSKYTMKEISNMINSLIAEKYLALTESQYAVVKLSQKAAPVLKGEEKVYRKVSKSRRIGGSFGADQRELSLDESLFEILRDIRKEVSQREGVPPFMIFHDSTLREMSKYYPIDEQVMLNIKGVGEKKFEKYGLEFMQVIRDYVEKNGVAAELINGGVPLEVESGSVKTEKVLKIPSHIVTLEFYRSGRSLEEIVQQRGLAKTTVQEHLFRCVSEGEEVDLDSLIPEGQEAIVLEAIEKVGGTRLKPLKEALPDEVEYGTIKAVLLKLEGLG